MIRTSPVLDAVYQSYEYKWILSFYADRIALRSRVPLMNHINEGLEILDIYGADEMVMRGFALHPLFQNDGDLMNHINLDAVSLCQPVALAYAFEYRRAANAYLCTPKTDPWSISEAKEAIGELLPQIHLMLIADKVQNRKDFMIHHYGSHDRSEQLLKYFNNWHELLGIDLPDDINPVEKPSDSKYHDHQL